MYVLYWMCALGTLAQNLWFLFPLALVVMKKSSKDTFFAQKEVLSEIWQCFLSNNDVFTWTPRTPGTRKF